MIMHRARCGAAAWLVVTILAQPMDAHHSFAAQYDGTKPVTLTGTVSKIEWTNPHARFYIDVKDDKGVITNWELELGSINMLIRYKFRRDTLRIGDLLTVEGFLARDGSKLANAKTIKFPDGRAFNGASSSDLGSTK
jgi:hypothetical protein